MIRKHSFRGVMAGFATSALALAVSAQAFAGTVTTDGADIVIKTKGGLEVATTDKEFSFKLGGKLQWDATNFDGLMAGTQNDPFDDTFNTFIRRGEVGFEGVAYKDWGYGLRVSYDEDEGTDFDRAYITYSGLGFADVTVGQFGVDYGLEGTTSSSWITAIERPFMYDFLNGDEDAKFGVNVMHAGDNYGLMAQVAHYDQYESDDNDELYGYTLRANWAPYLDGTDVIHLGANYHSSSPDDNTANVRTRMGIRSDEDARIAFGSTADTDKDSEWVLEAGAQFGSFRAAAEYFQRQVSGETAGGLDADVDASGYSAQVSYMIGGARNYKAGAGKWDKPTDMKGTFEVFARYESNTVDADESAIPAQMMGGVVGVVADDLSDEFTANAMVVGVNYFATPAVRMSLNYVDYEVDNLNTNSQVGGENVQDDGKAIIGRLQYVF
ncbi:OprO/OprP family phosphate-selective porin [Pseudomonas anguilliseptica]|uniref:Phosphate-selective porin OprO and OprP n=1 Tax=Pseudomonas anguilliseptica TaxID=53406 RepID=A0A1H4NY19_PSEAG|nr:porin [Pseudomonas anguilliseptica]SEB99905.1 phosphate-selective porin OprO and OprP [Pseudomonas anguilliseptica]